MKLKWLFGAVAAIVVAGCTTSDIELDKTGLSETPLHGKFVWHDLITDDVAAATAFYGALFGWKFHETRGPDGSPYTLIVGHDGRLQGGIVELADPPDEDYSRWLGYISVADVDATVETAGRLDGDVLVAPREIGKIARASVVRDPQGAIVGYLQSHVGDPIDPVSASSGEVVLNELLAANSLAAAAFYMETAGYEVESTWRNGGEYHTLVQGGVARAGLQDLPNDQLSPLWLTHFAVPDPGNMARKAEALGGTTVLAPSVDIRDGNLAVITDPTGAVLALDRIAN